MARVAVQAAAGIFSGLQSLHTDAYDEAITCPTEKSARIAVATQNILRDEAHLCDVIDPLGGDVPAGPGRYPAMIRAMGKALQDCGRTGH